MAVMIDLKDLSWRDNEFGTIHKIIGFHTYNDLNIVLYLDIETGEESCMDVDLFINKHTACGLFDDVESIY